jgi:hypothetical protein
MWGAEECDPADVFGKVLFLNAASSVHKSLPKSEMCPEEVDLKTSHLPGLGLPYYERQR